MPLGDFLDHQRLAQADQAASSSQRRAHADLAPWQGTGGLSSSNRRSRWNAAAGLAPTAAAQHSARVRGSLPGASGDEHEAGRAMVDAARPLERALVFFNQPPAIGAREMRRTTATVLGVSVAPTVFRFGVTAHLMRYQGLASRVSFFVMRAARGAAFRFVPTSLFRVVSGVTREDGGNGIVRRVVGLALFIATSVLACAGNATSSR